MALDLAKRFFDVGLFTNHLDDMLAFWQQKVGLAFDHVLPVGSGVRQHRHDMAGSVFKLNHARDPLPPVPAAGYRELLIAREGIDAPVTLKDPDGNAVSLVPPGHLGIDQVAVRLGVRDPEAHRRFYVEALGLEPHEGTGGPAFRCGRSVLLLEPDADAPADAEMLGAGYRYLTVQVRKVDPAHAAVLAAGGREGRAPATLGKVARISFVRDPDGNWIELSQRASLTGSLEE